MTEEPKPAASPHNPHAQHHEKSPEELAKEAAAKRRDEILQRAMHGKRQQHQHQQHGRGNSGGPKFSPSPIRRGPRGG